MILFVNVVLGIWFLAMLVDGHEYNDFKKEIPDSPVPTVEHIIDSLSKADWDGDEAPCRDKIFNVLDNVKNSTLWATWVWNSIDQSPTGQFFGARYHLGAYDQCLRPPWLNTHPELRTQYCLADVEMNEHGRKEMKDNDPYGKAEEYYLHTQTSLGRSFSYMAYGICVPAGCSRKSVSKFAQALLSAGYLRSDASVSIHHCEEAGARHEYSRGFYVYIGTLAALLCVAVASTYYVSEYPQAAKSDCFLNRVALSFDLRRNYGSVVKSSESELNFLHGVRCLVAALLPFFHVLIMKSTTSVSNSMDLELMLERPTTAYLVHVDVFTDAFFAISALLLGRGLASATAAKSMNLVNLVKVIFMRYLRLFGALAATVLYMAHVSMHTDDGPLYPKIALREQQACENNWWLTLLLVQNYFNTEEMCYPLGWYVTCDFQLFVLTLVLVYVYRRSARAGTMAAAAVLAAGLLSPALVTYMYDLPAVIAYNVGVVHMDPRKIQFFVSSYTQVYGRMAPYAVGLAVGYLMAIYEPKNHRHFISKTKSYLGVGLCLCLMLGVLAAGSWCFQHGVRGPLAAAFATLDRTAFAVAMLGFLAMCAYGDIPLVQSFLTWPGFAPLSRLTYGLYLLHPLILYRSHLSMRSHAKHHLFDMLTEAVGATAVSLALSLALRLLLEAPLLNVVSAILHKNTTIEKRDRPTTGIHQNKHSKGNAHNKQKIK